MLSESADPFNIRLCKPMWLGSSVQNPGRVPPESPLCTDIRDVPKAQMTQPPPLIDALRRLAGPVPDDRSDAELLARFVAAKDSAAFETLVRRHGGLVWGACRRRLRDAHAAEDAFQTTFLALARHAAGVRKPDALGAWLHRVAVRCTVALRPSREPMSALPPDAPARGPGPVATAEGRDLERAIDDEIDALPEPYRLAFVLCEIEERTAAEAARALGCAVGTVESRLTRARERLRNRLSRKGVTGGALTGLALAAIAVPPAARAGAVALGMGAVPMAAARVALADQVVRAPLVTGTAIGLSVAGVAALVGLGGLIWALARAPEQLMPAAPSPTPLPAALEFPEPEALRRNRQNFPLPPEAIARVGDPWLRHAGVPDRLTFSGDGRFLAAGAVGDRWLRVWDLVAGRPRAHLPLGPNEKPVAIALTPDGGILRAIVQAGEATHLREYDTFRGQETRRQAVTGPADAARFDPTASLVAIARTGEVRLLNAVAAIEKWRADGPTTNRVELAFAGRDRLAVLSVGGDRVRLLDVANGSLTNELIEPGGKLAFPTFSADGQIMAVWQGGKDRVQIWDVAGQRVDRAIHPPYPAAGLSITPDGSQVAVFTQYRGAHLWPARTEGRSRPIEIMGGVTGSFSADGAVLAVGNVFGVAQLVNGRTGLLHPATASEVQLPTPVAFHPPGDRLLLAGWMRWLDCATAGDDAHRLITPGAGPAETSVMSAAERAALSPDHTTLVRCTATKPDGKEFVLDVLDAATGAVRNRMPLDDYAHRPAFSPDGKTVYAIVARRLCGWDLITGQLVLQTEQPMGEMVSRLIVSPDGRFVATAVLVIADVQRARSIQVWDAVTGDSPIAAEAGHGKPYVAFSADGKRFAAAVVQEGPAPRISEVRVWDLDTRAVTAIFAGYDGQPAFSPDGRTLAVTGSDRVALLEFASGKERHVFRHHGAVEPALAWRPDGRVLAAASAEAPVYLWDVAGDRTGTLPDWQPTHDRRRWEALLGDDAAPAFQTLRQLWAYPTETAVFLRGRVSVDAGVRLAARACEALELPGTDDAKELLDRWASGPTNAPRTREAQETLRRLAAVAKSKADGGRG